MNLSNYQAACSKCCLSVGQVLPLSKFSVRPPIYPPCSLTNKNLFYTFSLFLRGGICHSLLCPSGKENGCRSYKSAASVTQHLQSARDNWAGLSSIISPFL